jgi:hypothetical protein
MDEFENRFLNLTQVAAWSLIRDPEAVRIAADLANEAALFEVREAHLERYWHVNERLWQESGWPKPNDPSDWRIDILAPDVDLPPRSAEGYAERLRGLEREGKIRIRQQNVFPMADYLLFCFREGRLTATGNAPGEARTRKLKPIDWASLEIAGGDHERLSVRRSGSTRQPAFEHIRVARAQVIQLSPSLAAQVPIHPQARQRAQTRLRDRANQEPHERRVLPNVRAEGAQVVLINAASIEPEQVSWLWRNWLQRGVFNLIAGKPGSGKSTTALSFCATVTSGGLWPDGEACSKSWRAVYWSGEDGIRDTLLPRFLAAGGKRENMEFVHEVREGQRKRPFDPSRDMQGLAQAVGNLGDVRLIVLDPVALAVRGDSHKNVETRQGLQPFGDLCASLGACGLGVHHLSKNTAGGDPLDRVSGSLAFGALPRCVLLAAKNLDGGRAARHALIRAKVSNGPDWGGFDYKLEQGRLDNWPDIEAQRVLWAASIEGSAREILAQFEDKPTNESPAVTFLVEALKGGPQLAAQVIANAGNAGIPERTLRRAFKDLGGAQERHGRGRDHFVVWELPRATQ